jgi:hypothetical protein
VRIGEIGEAMNSAAVASKILQTSGAIIVEVSVSEGKGRPFRVTVSKILAIRIEKRQFSVLGTPEEGGPMKSRHFRRVHVANETLARL